MRRTLLIAALVGPAIVQAQDLSDYYVDTPNACQFGRDIDQEEAPSRMIQSGGATLLIPWGIEAQEVWCEWEADIAYDWSQPMRQIRPGYCVASEHVTPTVFVIESFPELPGEFRVWQQGTDKPTVFRSCGP